MILVDSLNSARRAAGLGLLRFNAGPYLHARALEWDMLYDRFDVTAVFQVLKPKVDQNIALPSPLPQTSGSIPAPANMNIGKHHVFADVLSC